MSNQRNKIDVQLDDVFGEGSKGCRLMFWTATFFLLVTRFGIGLSDWSGKYNVKPDWGAPWGDLECHRTWFVITSNYTTD